MDSDATKQIALDALSTWGRQQVREFRRHGYPTRSIIASLRIDGGGFKDRTPNPTSTIAEEIEKWLATRPLAERAIVALYYGFEMQPRHIARSIPELGLEPAKISRIARCVLPSLGKHLIRTSIARRNAR
ncbi:MAG: hypothetical protein R3E87_23610 [Burkholderiaceae bacterium]